MLTYSSEMAALSKAVYLFGLAMVFHFAVQSYLFLRYEGFSRHGLNLSSVECLLSLYGPH